MSKRANGKMIQLTDGRTVFMAVCHHCCLTVNKVVEGYDNVKEKDYCQHLKTRLVRINKEKKEV